VPWESPLRWSTLLECALLAERVGFDSLWLSDHLVFDLSRYGGSSEPSGAFEPLVTLAALSRLVSRPRLGTLVLCEVLRSPALLAKSLATLDHLCGGRLDIGLGAGWYEPDYQLMGMTLPAPGVRLARLEETLVVLERLFSEEAAEYEGRFHRVRKGGARPLPLQRPHPPLILGGKGDRLLRLVAARADGWNTCWAWTPEAYRERGAHLDAACELLGRDPAGVRRSLGLYALTGENATDLTARFERMRELAPAGTVTGSLDDWRGAGRLVGSFESVAEQAAGFAALGVDELIVCAGPVPFSLVSLDDVEALASALEPIRGEQRTDTVVEEG
ncbi:MAG: TIGR03619 family F420-dependent LLM class oxidoreductase, partial [Acidimicrobiia bacterium]